MKTQNTRITYSEADQAVTAFADAICKARGYAWAVGALQAHLSYAISNLSAKEQEYMLRLLTESTNVYLDQI